MKYQKFNLSESFQYLTCLEELVIQSIEVLHESLQHMTSLKSLTMCDLPNLAPIPDWFGNLSLLQALNISQCPMQLHMCMHILCFSLTGETVLPLYGSHMHRRFVGAILK